MRENTCEELNVKMKKDNILRVFLTSAIRIQKYRKFTIRKSNIREGN